MIKLKEMLHDSARFEKLSDGWIKDNLLGVDWAPSSEETMEFKKAQDYCVKQGGRLPEIEELQSLVDYRKHDPTINEIFADAKTDDWYWSGTDTAWNKNYAWCVGFVSGGVGGVKVGNNYVRPVRASQ